MWGEFCETYSPNAEKFVTELDLIETLLVNGGIDVENYNNPEKGICQYEAIEKAIKELIKYRWKDSEED